MTRCDVCGRVAWEYEGGNSGGALPPDEQCERPANGFDVDCYRLGFERVSAERAGLLAALKDAADALRFVHGHDTCAEAAARSAIKKAEEP